MTEQEINQIETMLVGSLSNAQMATLHETLTFVLRKNLLSTNKKYQLQNNELLNTFLTAKRVEGCSNKTLKYYETVLKHLLNNLKTSFLDLTTEHLRSYLSNYQQNRRLEKSSLDNIRRVLSSLFSWLEEENYINKNPMKRIHKIKTDKTIKEAYSDEIVELLKDGCENQRNLAIINLLYSTGMRVGELTLLNKADIDFNSNECVVFGKGSKERKVFFDSETKIQLLKYIQSRSDNNEALFVSNLKPYKRLNISGVEILLRKLGNKLNIKDVHPHRFRRTLATKALNKGMPIEQIQLLLGHTKIDTTLRYAIVDQNNVKQSYRKLIG